MNLPIIEKDCTMFIFFFALFIIIAMNKSEK